MLFRIYGFTSDHILDQDWEVTIKTTQFMGDFRPSNSLEATYDGDAFKELLRFIRFFELTYSKSLSLPKSESQVKVGIQGIKFKSIHNER